MSLFKRTSPQKTSLPKTPQKTSLPNKHPLLQYKAEFEKTEPTFKDSQRNWNRDGDIDQDGDKDWDDLVLTTSQLGDYFEEHQSKGDGNCFYHSIVDYLDGTDSPLFKTGEFVAAWGTDQELGRQRRRFDDKQMFKMHWLRQLVYRESLIKLEHEDGQSSYQKRELAIFRNTLREGVSATETDRSPTHGAVGVELWGVDKEIDVTARIIGADICTFQNDGNGGHLWTVSFSTFSNYSLDGNVCFIKNNGFHFTNLTFRGVHRAWLQDIQTVYRSSDEESTSIEARLRAAKEARLRRRLRRQKKKQDEAVKKFAEMYGIDMYVAKAYMHQAKYNMGKAAEILYNENIRRQLT